ncbi:ABC transporter ATP-binding protein [Microbacterium sp. NPDC064584]|uniref:ABC transporter ATP-binding protein n=1 Tax=Microbacterium sp. NPDC064584 TaxID=3155817 RepID=UPI003444C678
MTPTITASGVRRSFGSVPAVRDISLQVEPGRVTGLVGPNGSGKTTLLLMLASLLAPDAGQIRIGGIDPVEDPSGVRRIIGWMPDALGAWGALSARETLFVTGRLYDLPRDAARDRAEELLRMVDLTALAASPARVLSRGQKQRLGLARALVHDPQVLLLDEPASGLDPEARVGLRVLLRQLAAQGRTVLVSSHILAELEEVVDDAVFLVAGATVSAERVAAAARSLRTWRVRVADADPAVSVEAIATALQRDAATLATDRSGVLVGFASDTEAAAALRALVEAGVPVIEYAPATGDLEHTFLDLRDGSAS